MLRFTLPILCAATMLMPTVLLSKAASAGEVRHRQVNQQHRIINGVRNGSINVRELQNLEQRAAAIERTRVRDLKDGKLSPQERRQLDQRQDQLSRAIYRDKHDRH